MAEEKEKKEQGEKDGKATDKVVDGLKEKEGKEEKGEETKKEESKPEEEGKKEEKVEEEEGGEEKKKKRFGLPKIGRKKGEAGPKAEMKEAMPDSEVAFLSPEHKLAHEIDGKFIEDSDTMVLKIKKSKVIFVAGLLVLLMWIIPLAKGFASLAKSTGLDSKIPFLSSQEEPVEEEIIEEVEGPKIRIRNASGKTEWGEEVANTLIDLGYEKVEIQEENEEYEGMSLIVKEGDEEVRDMINEALTAYVLASPSAQLTSDSDFDAVLLLGELIKKEDKGESLGVEDINLDEAVEASASGN